MVSFINLHRDTYGVEPICKVLPIAPSTYRKHKARERDPSLLPERSKRDAELKPKIEQVWKENRELYGAKKVWKELHRKEVSVARCTVARLMRDLGLRGTVRGKVVRTTISVETVSGLPDLVNRDFSAVRPNQLWVADFTVVPTWRGKVYVAFVIDVFSRRIVGWRASTSMKATLVLDALEQALYDRPFRDGEFPIHHSDRGSQYLSISYTDRLVDAGVDLSVGSVGDSYDNALAESIIGLFKTEVIKKLAPWRNVDDVELATLEWVAWFNTKRLLEPIGYVPPAEFEEAYYEKQPAEEVELVALN